MLAGAAWALSRRNRNGRGTHDLLALLSDSHFYQPQDSQVVTGDVRAELSRLIFTGTLCHDFREISGGVYREVEVRIAIRLPVQSVELFLELPGRINVNTNLRRVSNSYVGQLGLTEIRLHPACVLHQT